jgi:hypothetical protein
MYTQRWSDSEQQLLEHLDGRVVGKKFVSEYRRLAAIKGLPRRTEWAIICKANELSVTLRGGVFDAFSCATLAHNLGVCWQRVQGWIHYKGLPATRKGNRFLILVKDFAEWARENVASLGGISSENLFWLVGEILQVPSIPQTRSKPLVRLIDGALFPSIKEASRITYIGRYSIYRALRFGNEAGGSKWQYVEQGRA